MMYSKSGVSIDISDSNIRVMSVENEKVAKWTVQPLAEGLVKGGTIADPQAVGVAIDSLFTSLGLRRDQVTCTLTGLPFIYRTISMPDVKQGIPAESIEREARRELAVSEEDMYLFWQATELHQESNERDYFILAIPKTQLNALTFTLTIAKIKSPVLDLKPLAVARAASMRDAILISLEKNYIDIIMLTSGLVRVIHSISPDTKPDNVVGIVSDIVDAISKAVKYFNRDYAQSALPVETPIILAGEFSTNPEILKSVKNVTGHPVEVLKPDLILPEDIPAGVYASNTGLIIKNFPPKKVKSSYLDINVNLVPVLRKKRALQVNWSYTFLITVAALTTFLVYKSYDMKTTVQENIASLQQSATQISDQLKSNQSINKEALADKQVKTDQYAVLENQIITLKQASLMIANQQIDYASMVTDLISTLPVQADYSNIAVHQEEIEFSGTIADPMDALLITDALEKIKYVAEARVVSLDQGDMSETVSYRFQISIRLKPGFQVNQDSSNPAGDELSGNSGGTD
jgi:Tfp pilus assembly PilM family ATPase